jgi:hypothetical protein
MTLHLRAPSQEPLCYLEPINLEAERSPVMPKKATSKPEVTPEPQAAPEQASVQVDTLAKALVQAIEATKPVAKKNSFNRVPRTPWTPKDGSKKIKLKRKMYQHGLLIDEARISNDEAVLLNKVRTGRFCDNYVTIYRRKDRGVDITYPIRTASQKLRLVNEFGIRNFKELLERCIQEADNPKPKLFDEDGDAL